MQRLELSSLDFGTTYSASQVLGVGGHGLSNEEKQFHGLDDPQDGVVSSRGGAVSPLLRRRDEVLLQQIFMMCLSMCNRSNTSTRSVFLLQEKAEQLLLPTTSNDKWS